MRSFALTSFWLYVVGLCLSIVSRDDKDGLTITGIVLNASLAIWGYFVIWG